MCNGEFASTTVIYRSYHTNNSEKKYLYDGHLDKT